MKCNCAPLLEEERPEKRRVIEKGDFLNLLPMDVLHFIDDWLDGLEYRVTFKNSVTQIHGPRNHVLCIATNDYWKFLPYFVNFSLYNTICYEWAYLCYNKS